MSKEIRDRYRRKHDVTISTCERRLWIPGPSDFVNDRLGKFFSNYWRLNSVVTFTIFFSSSAVSDLIRRRVVSSGRSSCVQIIDQKRLISESRSLLRSIDTKVCWCKDSIGCISTVLLGAGSETTPDV